MKNTVLNVAIAAAIATSSTFAFAAVETFNSNTQIRVDGSKGGNYGFTLTMEEVDVMYYDATSKKFISQNPNGVRGKVSLAVPTSSGADDAAAFVLKAKLDNAPANANKLMHYNGTLVNKGALLTAVVDGHELTGTDTIIDLASWIGHPLDSSAPGTLDAINQEPVYVSIKDVGTFGVADPTALPDGEYRGHADIAWTASFGS